MKIEIDCTDLEDAIGMLEDLRNDIDNGDLNLDDYSVGELLCSGALQVEF